MNAKNAKKSKENTETLKSLQNKLRTHPLLEEFTVLDCTGARYKAGGIKGESWANDGLKLTLKYEGTDKNRIKVFPGLPCNSRLCDDKTIEVTIPFNQTVYSDHDQCGGKPVDVAGNYRMVFGEDHYDVVLRLATFLTKFGNWAHLQTAACTGGFLDADDPESHKLVEFKICLTDYCQGRCQSPSHNSVGVKETMLEHLGITKDEIKEFKKFVQEHDFRCQTCSDNVCKDNTFLHLDAGRCKFVKRDTPLRDAPPKIKEIIRKKNWDVYRYD